MGPIIRFGRYAGQTVATVDRSNPGYLALLVATRRLAERYPDVALEAKRLLVRRWSAELDQARGRGIAGDLV